MQLSEERRRLQSKSHQNGEMPTRMTFGSSEKLSMDFEGLQSIGKSTLLPSW